MVFHLVRLKVGSTNQGVMVQPSLASLGSRKVRIRRKFKVIFSYIVKGQRVYRRPSFVFVFILYVMIMHQSKPSGKDAGIISISKV